MAYGDIQKAVPVIIKNAEDACIIPVVITNVNKVYRLPGVRVHDGFPVNIIASPLNGANIFLCRGNQPTQFNSIILQPNTSVHYFIESPNIFYVVGFAVNDVVIVSCELAGGRG